jgi:glycosyltransferase involved in cell wall biosynthesis
MKILFLYTELAEYVLSCINELLKKEDYEIHIVRWPVNSEAPFRFCFHDNIKIYNRNHYSSAGLEQLALQVSPNIIYSSGWRDKGYLKVCKKFKSKIPVIVGFDNKWTNSLKQQLASAFSKITIHRYFSHCWIPGAPQMEFAHRLGFKPSNILTGLYSCDYSFFNGLFHKYKEEKKKNFPHRFVYVGRYYTFKGIQHLWDAFSELHKETPSDWELWCMGTGDIPPIAHPKIKHFGFVQPKEMENYVATSGVFVLPSTFEPWGVVVHEFAAAGFPLICSHEVGASSSFLREGENGFFFQAGNKTQLKEVLKKISNMSNEQLYWMGIRSTQLAAQITPEKWVESLVSVLNNYYEKEKNSRFY